MLCLIHLIHKGYWDTLGIPHVFAGKSMAMFELSEVSFGFFIRKPHLTFEMAGRIQWIHTSSNPPKKENRNLSPKQIILFQYQTTDPLFFRKHLFNGFLLVQTTQQVNLKPPEFCKSIVIWFGFFSVRGCDLHLMGCSRSLVYEGSGSQCVSDSKEISKVIKAATFFFVRCVDVVLFWKHVLSLKLVFEQLFFSWYNFCSFGGEFPWKWVWNGDDELCVKHVKPSPNSQHPHMKSIMVSIAYDLWRWRMWSTNFDLRLLPICKVEGRVNPLKTIWCCCS